MDIQQLNFFIKVATMLHFSHAAEELNITQSALSKSISKLEQEINAKLFVRSGRNIELSEYGELFLPYAIDIVNLVNSGKNSIKNKKIGINEPIMLHTVPLQIYNGLLNKILQVCPTLNISTLSTESSTVLHGLLTGKIDLILVGQRFKNTMIDSQLLYSEKIKLLVSSSHPLSSKNSVSIADLANYSFAVLNKNTGLFEAIEKKRIIYDCNFIINTELNSIGEIFEYISTEKYLSFVGEYTLLNYLSENKAKNYKLINISDFDFSLDKYLYWRKNEIKTSVKKVKDVIIYYFENEFDTPAKCKQETGS